MDETKPRRYGIEEILPGENEDLNEFIELLSQLKTKELSLSEFGEDRYSGVKYEKILENSSATKLNLSGISNFVIDMKIEKILSSCPNKVRQLYLKNSNVGPLTLNTIPNFTVLKELSLKLSEQINTEKFIKLILSPDSTLKSLSSFSA